MSGTCLFTANYAYTPSNFEISNLPGSHVKENPYYPAFCVVKNILQRGNPTLMSRYLQEALIPIYKFDEFAEDRHAEVEGGIENIRKTRFEKLKVYSEKSLSTYEKASFFATAVIRFEILILELLQRKVLKLEDKEWKFNVLSNEKLPYNKLLAYAIEDVFLWLENLLKLMKLEFKKPRIYIELAEKNSFRPKEGYINIDFSLTDLKPNTHENDVITIRTKLDGNDYFRLETTQPIKYKVNIDENDRENDIDALKFFLRNIFGFEEFTDGQIPVIAKILSGEDTVALLPTGRGKSLCYQFAALLQPAVSLVISPLKSLMFDQDYNLKNYFMISRTNHIYSDQTQEEKEKVMREYLSGKYFFIFVTPERLQTPDFRECMRNAYNNLTIAYAIIDEVHCLSEWGHDFRTSYANLVPTIRRLWPGVKFLGLTATALPFVLIDLTKELGISSSNIVTPKSFTRPELEFFVIKNHSEEERMQNFLSLLKTLDAEKQIFTLRGEDTYCGVVFTQFKEDKFKYKNIIKGKGCISLAQTINSIFGNVARSYSGDDGDLTRQKIQTDFKENKFPLLVATSKSYGIGIDKSNIRYTIHYGLPMSIETLYQEVGRAGRDRRKAECYILYTENPPLPDGSTVSEFFSRNVEVREIVSKLDNIFLEYKEDPLIRLQLLIGDNKGVESDLDVLRYVFYTYAAPNCEVSIEFTKSTLRHELPEILSALELLKSARIVESFKVEDKYSQTWGSRKSYGSKNSNLTTIHVKFSNLTKKEALENYAKAFKEQFTENIKALARYILVTNHSPAQSVSINLKDNVLQFSRREIEKAVHRMKMIGLVDDWTMEWIENEIKLADSNDYVDYLLYGSENLGFQKKNGDNRALLKIKFSHFNEQQALAGVVRYIRRYDTEFTLDKNSIYKEKYEKYISILDDDYLDEFEKTFKIMVAWLYDNLVYSRRQSLWNAYELCKHYTNSESFKKSLERYFAFSNFSRKLEIIAERPLEYQLWFDVFYFDRTNGITISKPDELLEIDSILKRLFESYKENTGLDFVSGLTNLMLEQYDDLTRLDSSLSVIVGLGNEFVEKVLDEFVQLYEKRMILDKGKEEFCRLLVKYYEKDPKMLKKIYMRFKDTHSFEAIIKNSIERLRNVLEEVR